MHLSTRLTTPFVFSRLLVFCNRLVFVSTGVFFCPYVGDFLFLSLSLCDLDNVHGFIIIDRLCLNRQS